MQPLSNPNAAIPPIRTIMAQNLKALLEKYNERVAAVETDLSLRITIPASLGD